MHVNPSTKKKGLAWAKAKASEMRRAAQILLDRAAELDALVSNNSADARRDDVPGRRYGREYGAEVIQIYSRKRGPLLSNGRRPHRAK